MLNGIFGKWLREFATLVLTQTVQAFLLAIVMTVIISCLGNSGGSAEGNQALRSARKIRKREPRAISCGMAAEKTGFARQYGLSVQNM